MISERLVQDASDLFERAKARGYRLATAESCTGGLIAASITAVPGASVVLERGFVTYSNEAKVEMLGVSAELIERHGAVSQEVALAMVDGALKHSRADIALAVTGIAGPDGGS
ncbi:MAG: CinA family protein, partial [Vitreimonas sp.]